MVAYRVIKTGHIIEIYEYEHLTGGADNNFFDEERKVGRDGGRDNEGKEERKAEYAVTVNQRARNMIRRLVNANFNHSSHFITLTFKENMTDVKKANHEFQKFIKRMKRRQPDFKHVTVIEFQKRGAVHYHMLCNYAIAWKTTEQLREHERYLGQELWGHGFADIGFKKNGKVDNVGAYLVKYMTKDNADERLAGKKRYFKSENLVAPEELHGLDALPYIKQFEGTPAVFTSQYYSDFHGTVKHKEYNPLRYAISDFKEAVRVDEEKHVLAAVAMFGDFVEVFE